jgi:VWFA-related protein
MGRRLSCRVLVVGLAYAGVFFCLGARHPAAQAGARERTLFVTVVDQMDNPVEGLGVADLVVREDGVRREVLRLSRATEPLDVAVLVDNASSSEELVPRVREGLKGFIAAMTPQHSVALVALADRPTILVDYTTNAQSLLTGAGRLFTMARSGMTLLDALVEVSDGMRQREAARTAIVPIVTDGIEFTHLRYKDVTDAIARSGAAVYPITVGRFPLSTDDTDHDRLVVLSTAPETSGGRRFSLLSSNAVEATMAKVARHLTSQYKVVYSRPDTLIPPEKIDVTSPRPALTVHGTPARGTGATAR